MYNITTMTISNQTKTRTAYLSTRVLDTPLWGMYNILAFILYKDLHISALQLAVLIAIKPLVSIFSMYWSSLVVARPERLKSNILIARILGVLPFFLYPFFDSPLFFIASSAVYMTFVVGIVPAWMEMLKRNLPEQDNKKIFAYGSSLGYLGGALFPFAFALILDPHPHAWRWLFPAAAFISLSALPLLMRLPKIDASAAIIENTGLKEKVTAPWKNAWALLVARPDFARYQMAFMVLGSGLMLFQPALPIFFVDGLGLSYVDLTVALALSKGVSYALASPMWARWMNGMDIFRFSAMVTALACLFPVLLLLTKLNLIWLYIAYICYGVMQAGSEMSWNLSGPIFAKEKESSLFTTVNVVSVGIRGAIAPTCGSLLCGVIGATGVIGLGAVSFLCATALFLRFSRQHQAIPDADRLSTLPERS